MKLPVSLTLAALLTIPSTAALAAVTVRAPRPAAQVFTTPHASTFAVPHSSTLTAPHAYFGTLLIVRTTVLTVKLRTGQTLVVDATRAAAQGQVNRPFAVGSSLAVTGNFLGGALVATSVRPVTPIAAYWPPDR